MAHMMIHSWVLNSPIEIKHRDKIFKKVKSLLRRMGKLSTVKQFVHNEHNSLIAWNCKETSEKILPDVEAFISKLK